ncbi:NAD(P)H-dependent glycerol-3-phosphate dehydrogenase [Patescibacteria group bacterium]|nr:NAD(P)H-dependent glycerol-3-phosphate dehydrogenase [Patescibacteria group bacterium]MBU1922386.1 NAD(P)H-dependent glycerol-3-phosphate dehydrogenase [Patescibacteria group bacterium]
MKQIATIGSGNMGTAMSQLLAQNGHKVRIWSIEQSVLKEIAQKHTNKKYLPGIKLHPNIMAKPTDIDCLKGADVVMLAVPSHVIMPVLKQIKNLLTRKMIIFSVTKGLNQKTLQTTAQEIIEFLPAHLKNNFVNMTGPAVALDIARRTPTAVEIASLSPASAKQMKNLLQNSYFKVNITKDLAGAALCASLKNVYAVALGISQGLEYKLNTQAMLFTAAVQEMAAILAKMRAKPGTAMSLSGIGDLTVTGFNPKSRNVTYGRLASQKGAKTPAQLGMRQVAEGYFTAPLLARLMKKKKIHAPLIFLVDDIIKKKKNPKKGLHDFIERLSF